MSNIKISIIVPIYNGEKYIKTTIDNLLNQSINQFELILVNDGSSDNSSKILDEYAKIDSKIKVIHQKNKGVSSARNAGISAASGNYLGFVDSDDLIDVNMYEAMYNKAIQCNADIVCCGFIEEDNNGNTFRTYDFPFPNKILNTQDIRTNFLKILNDKLEILGGGSMCTKIFRRSFIKNKGILVNENITVGEDLCFNIEALYNANLVTSVDKRFYHYMKINPNSIMTKSDDKKFRNFINGRMHILNTLKKYNLNSDAYTKFEYSRNLANLIQIADYRLINSKNYIKKYNEVINILKSEEIKDSITLSDNKFLSKNLQIIKNLVRLHLYFIIFLILYIKSIIPNK